MGKDTASHIKSREGLTFIEVIVSIGILVLLFSGVYVSYLAILGAVSNSEARIEAVSLLNRQIEIVRNLSYGSVGTAGGIPSGAIPQTQSVSSGRFTFAITTTVRNIDDPFDGTLGGAQNDTAPADYKLVELSIDCTSCGNFTPLALTTTVAPKNLESATSEGSLFIKALTASGALIPGATVRVQNAITSPTIDLTDTTNSDRVLQLVGVPTSTISYEISVSKPGYSSERTYSSAELGGLMPAKPHYTVAEQLVTEASFKIDLVSNLTVYTSDIFCRAEESKDFSAEGEKTLDGQGTVSEGGTLRKFATSTTTNADGEWNYGELEWDTYHFMLDEAVYDLVGTLPPSPLVVDPGTDVSFRLVITPMDPQSLFFTITEGNSVVPVPDAEVSITSGAFSAERTTARAKFGDTTWTGGQYASADGVDTESAPGEIRMSQIPGGYSTTTVSTLESLTFDTGSTSTVYYGFSWNPTLQPGGTELKFQLASNSDSTTWNYTGPNNNPADYYTASDVVLGVGHNGNRYLRYKAYLTTSDALVTPSVGDITFEFTGACVPAGHALFQALSNGTYDYTVTAAGYDTVAGSVSISGPWTQVDVELMPQ